MVSSNLPPMMRAVVHTQSSQTLSFDPQHPLPVPDADEYLIKVSATAITTGELIWPRPSHLDTSHPGVEMAGTIISPPSSLSNPKFHPGDKVYLRTTYPRSGSAREYSTARESELALRPLNISATSAAAIPVAALTAWQGLFVHAGLVPDLAPRSSSSSPSPNTPPLRILINGASSATGLMFLQLASLHHPTPTITTTSSAKNIPLLSSLGAHTTIDYTTTPLPPSSFDLIFDCAGLTPPLWTSLAPRGKLYTIVPPFDITKTEEWRFDLSPPGEKEEEEEGEDNNVTGKFYIMEAKGEDLEVVTRLVEEGRVRVVVDSVWGLGDYKGAFGRMDTGRAVGKVVLRVSDDDEEEEE